jgi:hypothetical protein
MILKKFFCLLILCWSVGQVNCQDTRPSFIPPAPQTSEFAKYINYNVSLYNGVPEISIPLYTIHLKGMDVPVSLTYHASGIKYHQTSGDVGVGWTLNPGYRISRTIYGLQDDKYDMPATLSDDLNSLAAGYQRDTFLAKLLDPDLPPVMPQPKNPMEHHDGQYDIFSYSLPTVSGSFVITDRANKVIQTLDEDNVRMTYTNGTSAYVAGYQDS